jgi:D-beta-D-heptose 7-phosphate kinase/D-beta-D-heptose 1-phosphate adenosyltransferase
MSKIFTDIRDLRESLQISGCVATSGGFDPMHVGHLRCLQESAKISRLNHLPLVVIVNGDGFLRRKKDFAFMPEAERLEIIAGVRGVDYVVPWDDGGQTVTGALEILRPTFFTKGGDRDSAANVPEFDLCDRIGCEVLFGVGGGKIQSSSDLVKSVRK